MTALAFLFAALLSGDIQPNMLKSQPPISAS